MSMKLLYKVYFKAILITILMFILGIAMALINMALINIKFVSFFGFLVTISGPLVSGVYLFSKWGDIKVQLTEKEKSSLNTVAYLIASTGGIVFSIIAFFIMVSA